MSSPRPSTFVVLLPLLHSFPSPLPLSPSPSPSPIPCPSRIYTCYFLIIHVHNLTQLTPLYVHVRLFTTHCGRRAGSLISIHQGSAPSKDTLWTSDNGKFSVPGCPWTPDHETPAAELHVVIALMTTGPVGISDLIGMTNATLAKRMITEDGTLLKPSKPITTVDSFFSSAVPDIVGEDSLWDSNAVRSGARTPPPGNVYTTYTGEQLSAPTAWYFVSFKMSKVSTDAYIRTHTHTHIYIYIYECVCVCIVGIVIARALLGGEELQCRCKLQLNVGADTPRHAHPMPRRHGTFQPRTFIQRSRLPLQRRLPIATLMPVLSAPTALLRLRASP